MSLLSLIGILTALAVFVSGFTYTNNQYHWNSNSNSIPGRYQPRTLREGQECKEEGFFRDSEDCQKFYRCAMLPDAIGNKITRYEFRCPGGTVFDEQIATCNYASQMENPPQNCRAENPPPAQQIPQVPSIPGQGGSGGDGSQQQQPGSNQQFPQLPPNQQQPQVPGVQQPSNPGSGNQQIPQVPSNPQGQGQQPQVPGVPSNQQPSVPGVPQPGGNPGSGSGSQQQPGSQSQVPNFPISQPGGGNQQIPGGFPNQPGQQQPQPPQVFFLPNSGQQWYYVPQYSVQQHQNRAPITFGML